MSGRHGRRIVRFTLPVTGPGVDFLGHYGSRDRQEMVLDTVFLDIAPLQTADWRIYLSWRINFEVDLFSHALISLGRLQRAVVPPGGHHDRISEEA